ncbi:MAG TPA: hypothetical protein VF041_11825 [Gemmatimonadaceae bacterium]
MYKALLAAAAVIMCLGCGSDSTGPKGNTQKNYLVTVSNAGFSPDTVHAAARDTVSFNVTEGVHAVTFYGTLPPNAAPSSGPVAAGSTVFTVFLTAGTYTFRDDSLDTHTGVIIVQ